MSKTLANNKNSLLAAFTTPIKKAAPSSSTKNNTLKATNSASSICSSSSGSEQGDHDHHEQHQQEVFCTSPYATFTQDIQGPTFIPVFPSVEAILPHANNTNKGQVAWKCSFCDNSAFGHKCGTCQRPRDVAALRVFMGQLSKEGDVELVTKMIEVLCPEIDFSQHLFHIEPHTAASTSRGRGCAWAYVDSLDHLLYICKRLHKRTYPTVNAQTGEVGFVAFPDFYAEADIKAAFDNDMSFLPESVQFLFHRSPITAEVPKTLQRSLQLPQNASTVSMESYQQQRHERNQQQQQFYAAQRQAQVQAQQQQLQAQAQNLKPTAYSAPSNNNKHKQQQAAVVQEQKQQQHQHQEAPQELAVNNKQSPGKMLKRYHWNPYSPSSSRTQCA